MRYLETLKRFLPFLTVFGIVFYLLLGQSDSPGNMLKWIVVVGVLPLLLDILYSIWRGQFGVDLIALLSISGSLLLGEYLAGAIILLMLSGGEYLEDYAMRRSRKELKKLLESMPETAYKLIDGDIQEVKVESVVKGDILVVKSGGVVPVDGEVMEGQSSVNEANLTGESLPVMKQAHSKVFSGTTNIDKPLNIKATKTSKTSSYQQIVALVKKAESEKAPFVRMADRYSVFFTLAALTISGGAWLMTGDPTRALTVLVVATPCPLILATPIAFTAGISDAAKKGIIFKTGGVMETLAEPDVFIFDKTGTLTLGKPQIINIELNADDTNISKKDVLEIVASVEQLSTHILAKTFVEAAKEQKIKLRVPNEMQEHLGFGVKASFGEDVYYIGKPDFLNDEGVKVAKTLVERYSASRQQGEMMVFLANKKSVLAVFTLRDEPRENIKETLDYVKKISKQLVMLTGDKQEVAEDIAKRFEIEDFQAECLPEEKLARVKKCQDTGKKVIMIGDGVNDAPALASADVGIAIGTLGSNASTDASDVVITVPDITRIQSAISISKRVVYIARQGIFIGIGLSIGLMFLGSFGLFVPVAGALFQEVIDVIVILNALRVKRI